MEHTLLFYVKEIIFRKETAMMTLITTNLNKQLAAYDYVHMFSLPCFDAVESRRYALGTEWTSSKQINRKLGRFRHLLT